MTDEPVIPDYPAQLIAGHWVLPTINEQGNDVVVMHVSISLDQAEALTGTDVDVTVQTDQGALARIEEPVPSDPLPTVSTKGSTAIALYRYANPGNAPLTVVDVSVLGETASFDVSTGIV